MHPAPSVILFTTLSGAGFGLLAFLCLGFLPVTGLAALLVWGLAYGLAVGGLLASTFHLGNPQRFLLAFTQWRTSWLSREGWAAVLTLSLAAPMAAGAVFGWPAGGWVRVLGLLAAVGVVLTILSTSMIYAQMKTVPRWHHWTVPLSFAAFALAGGLILAAPGWPAALACLLLGAAMMLQFDRGDRRFAQAGASLASATGLGPAVRPFAPPHTSPNYIMREMIFVVGRKHALKLRALALLLAALVPALLMLVLPPGPVASALAFASYLPGALAQRWLFFAEAEHVVSHYYGRGAPA